MANVLQLADLRDQGVLVELKLPLSSKRLDVLITGSNPDTKRDSAVIVELKQWTEVGRSNITDCVTVDYGGRPRDMLHPSRQVERYQRYLLDTHPAFADDPAIAFDACAYLHFAQHDPKSPLYHADFATLLGTNPSFAGDQSDALATFLDNRLAGADDGAILERVAATAFRPHKRLLDHVARVIRNEPVFTLLDEQQVAYNAIMDSVRGAGQNQQKVAFIVARRARHREVGHRGQPRRRAVRARHPDAPRHRARRRSPRTSARSSAPAPSAMFKYFRDTANVDEPLDVVILDEAHRIRSISTSRFTPAKARTGKAQIDDILDASRVSVFFIDDLQVVRPGEVGSTDLIREAAAKRSLEVREFELEAQFRSNGSDSFIKWVDNTLELDRTPQVLWPADDEFDFRVVGSVKELDTLIRGRAGEGSTARLVAGFCWPWSDPDAAGELEPDVRVGDWSMPWNARAEAGRLAPGIPKSDFWASDPRGIEQVGCVYTAQGFEFDYVGVIFGPDLVYRTLDGGWVGQRDQSHDRIVRSGVTEQQFTDFVKSTYRVLLTRGLRGCYVYFMDAPTRDFVLSRIERAPGEQRQAAEGLAPYSTPPD